MRPFNRLVKMRCAPVRGQGASAVDCHCVGRGRRERSSSIVTGRLMLQFPTPNFMARTQSYADDRRIAHSSRANFGTGGALRRRYTMPANLRQQISACKRRIMLVRLLIDAAAAKENRTFQEHQTLLLQREVLRGLEEL